MQDMRKSLSGLFVAVSLWAAGSCSHQTPTIRRAQQPRTSKVRLPAVVSGWVKVFKGPEGLVVEMVRLEDNTYLVRVTGTTSPLDGKVLRCKYRRDGWFRSEWRYDYDGAERILLLRRTRNGRSRMQVFLLEEPGLSGSEVTFSAPDSRKLDPRSLVDAHLSQRASGIFREMARFHKKAAIRRVEQEVSKKVHDLEAACQGRFRFHIDWKTAGPVTAKNVNISSSCSAPLWSLATLCKAPGAAPVVRSGLEKIECRIGTEPSLRLAGKTLVWTVPRKFHYIIGSLRKKLANEIIWPNGLTLAQVIYDHQITMWSNGQGLYLGLKPVRPRDRIGSSLYPRRQFFYGTRKMGMRLVPLVKTLDDHYFYDPRYPTSDRNRHFRGMRMNSVVRVHSKSDNSPASFKCGYRHVVLKPVPYDQTKAILSGVKWLSALKRRQPYGLARDRKGIYYYVDRAPGAEKRDFRLYRGRLGKLVRLQMTNLVTDSEGDVFSTPNGKLRLVLEKEHSYWVRKGRKQRLLNVPIEKNLSLIYTDLGVYEGQPFGSPCDIF